MIAFHICGVLFCIGGIILTPVSGAWKVACADKLKLCANISVLKSLPCFDDILFFFTHFQECAGKLLAEIDRAYDPNHSLCKRFWRSSYIVVIPACLSIILPFLSAFALLSKLLELEFILNNDWDLQNVLL